VVHRRGRELEFGIEHNGAFFLFEFPQMPIRSAQAVMATPTGTRPLDYLTGEDGESGMVWDLGTYEVVEGSLAKGKAEIFLSGRRLEGAWEIALEATECRITNRGGHLLARLKSDASALQGLSGSDKRAARLRRTG
jgi:hypothetical protein